MLNILKKLFGLVYVYNAGEKALGQGTYFMFRCPLHLLCL